MSRRKSTKTGLMYVNKSFDINKETGTVKCTLYFSLLGRKDNPIFKIGDNKTMNRICKSTNNTNFPYFTAVGTARCNKDDEFNEDFGKKLALTRAQEHAFIIASRAYGKIYNDLSNLSDMFYKYAYNCSFCVHDAKKHANELLYKNI